jgi:hypothetical protein
LTDRERRHDKNTAITRQAAPKKTGVGRASGDTAGKKKLCQT